MCIPRDHITAVTNKAKRKARPGMNNWHAWQLEATSKKACNMQAITCSYVVCQNDCTLVFIERLQPPLYSQCFRKVKTSVMT